MSVAFLRHCHGHFRLCSQMYSSLHWPCQLYIDYRIYVSNLKPHLMTYFRITFFVWLALSPLMYLLAVKSGWYDHIKSCEHHYHIVSLFPQFHQSFIFRYSGIETHKMLYTALCLMAYNVMLMKKNKSTTLTKNTHPPPPQSKYPSYKICVKFSNSFSTSPHFSFSMCHHDTKRLIGMNFFQVFHTFHSIFIFRRKRCKSFDFDKKKVYNNNIHTARIKHAHISYGIRNIMGPGFISIKKFRFYVKWIGKSICTNIPFLNALRALPLDFSASSHRWE